MGQFLFKTACVAAAIAAASLAVADDGTCGLPHFRATVIQRVNAVRALAQTCGGQRVEAARALRADNTLFEAAALHSQDMARRDYFAHASPEGRRVGDRATAAGYHWHAIGENLAAGDRSIDAVMDGWLASPSHCHNLMNSAYVHVGVSCVHRPGTAWETYWTLMLGRP